MTMADTLDAVDKLGRDVRATAATMTVSEVRGLIDLYYQMQQHRIDLDGQVRAAVADDRPHDLASHFAEQMRTLERQIPPAMLKFAEASEVGRWSLAQKGIGPVIAAGFLAHIDIRRAPTVGHIWRFAGLDPSVKWGKGQKRPWNARLKVLCWKAGESFKKVSGLEDAFYGEVYRDRKKYEVDRDVAGGNAEAAARTLTEKKFRDAGVKAVYESGHLPAGRLDLRATRYAVKLFLAHWHQIAYEAEFGGAPPLPYPVAHMGHAHVTAPPPG